MSERDELLEFKTYKEKGMDVAERVFRTLTDVPEEHQNKKLMPEEQQKRQAEQDTDRAVRAIAYLLDHLNKKGILNEDALDELLLKVIGH